MKTLYTVTGLFVRREGIGKGAKKTIFKHGESIIPTAFELANYPNKFATTIIDDSANDDNEEINYTILNALKEDIEINILADDKCRDIDPKIIEKIKKVIGRNPEKQSTVDKLVEALNGLKEQATKKVE